MRKYFLIFLFLLFFPFLVFASKGTSTPPIIMSAPSCSPEPTVQDYFTNAPDDIDVIENNVGEIAYAGQAFTASADYTLLKVALKLAKHSGDSPGTLSIFLKLAVDGLPSGDVLSSGTIDANNFVDYPSLMEYDILMSSYDIVKDVQYVFYLVSGAATPHPNYVAFAVINAGGYSGGTSVHSNDAGVSWSTRSYDFYFLTYGSFCGTSTTMSIINGFSYGEVLTNFFLFIIMVALISGFILKRTEKK